jgi:hypothetical protein
MPSSAVREFTDPDEYAAAIRATKADVTVTGRGHFAGKRTRIDFHRLWMQRLSENMPRVVHSAFVTGRAIVTFRVHTGPGLLWSGATLQPTNIIQHVEGENAFQRSPGPAVWGAMSLPVADMISVGAAMAGLDLTPPMDPLILTPLPAAMARLQRLHAAAGQLAEDAPAVIAHPEAARGLEQALIEAMVDCLGEGTVGEDRSAQRKHSLIMRRFRRAVEESTDQPRYIPELCKSIGVSDRTLRVLPGAAGDEPQAIPAVTPDESRAAGPARWLPRHDKRDRDRHAIWLLAIRTLCRRIQIALRRNAVRYPLPRAPVARVRDHIFRHFCQK